MRQTNLDGADEKLGSVGVWSRVGHRQNTFPSVLQFEVLIIELGTCLTCQRSPLGICQPYYTSQLTSVIINASEKLYHRWIHHQCHQRW